MANPIKEENLYTAYQVAIYPVILSELPTYQPLIKPNHVELVRKYLSQSDYGEKLVKRSGSKVFRAIYKTATELFAPGVASHLLTRKNYIETRTREFLGKYKDAQIVSIGGGFDTLLSRLAIEGFTNTLIELDYPSVAERKSKVCQRDNLEFIGVDLNQTTIDDALAQTRFDASKPVFFIAEGVMMYVPVNAAFALLKRLPKLSTGPMQMVFSALAPDENEQLLGSGTKKLFKKTNTQIYWSKTADVMKSDLKKAGFRTLEQLDSKQMHKAGFGIPNLTPKKYFAYEYYNWIERADAEEAARVIRKSRTLADRNAA